MIGFEKGSLRLSFAVALLFGSTLSVSAHAAPVTVSVHYADDSQRELAERLVSELSSEGYAVELRPLDEASPCDPNGEKLGSVTSGTRAWIRLSDGAPGSETVVATICYLGSLPFLQQASPSAPRGDPRQLALAAAEALNGLRSKLPPVVPTTEGSPARDKEPHANAPVPKAASAAPENSIALAGALMSNAPDFPVVPALTTSVSVGFTSSAGLFVDALFPVGGAELTSPEMTATVRTAWFRIGPRLRWAAGDFDLSGAAVAGPALSWATAVARPPLAGSADVKAGAVLSLVALVEYPRRAPIFARATASASALLPGVHVKLGTNGSEPLGAWPLEASLGLGVRWGGDL